MSAIGELADTEFCYLTTRGRRSGTEHRIEIWFVAHDHGAYLLSNSTSSDWYRNIVEDPGVTLEIATESRDTVTRPIDADDPSNEIVRPAMVAKYQARDEDDLAAWSRDASLVRIEWPPTP